MRDEVGELDHPSRFAVDEEWNFRNVAQRPEACSEFPPLVHDGLYHRLVFRFVGHDYSEFWTPQHLSPEERVEPKAELLEDTFRRIHMRHGTRFSDYTE
jgi:hypothetical protein